MLLSKFVRWEEKREDSGVKWTFLEHKGPVFAPNYEPLPKNVRFYYDGNSYFRLFNFLMMYYYLSTQWFGAVI